MKRFTTLKNGAQTPKEKTIQTMVVAESYFCF